jgi:hypothetical protein
LFQLSMQGKGVHTLPQAGELGFGLEAQDPQNLGE